MAHDIAIVTEAELREAVKLDMTTVDVVERAFAALATGEAVMPPILSMAIEAQTGEVDVKTAYVPGLRGFAVKISSGFFDNPKLGLASLNGLMVLLSSRTGIVQAVLLDNGYLTDLRTAAAGTVAAKHLAPARVTTAAVFGAGLQAELQLRALKLVRDFTKVLVWARDAAKAEAHAARLGEALGCDAQSVAQPEDCVRQAQVVVTATPSRTPLFGSDCLHPGLHITAMGSDSAGKNEIHPEVLVRADRFVCDRKSQSVALGEMRSAIAAGVMTHETPVDELGEICAQLKPGRTSADALTVCDLTGTGVQDTAIATLAFERARNRSLGVTISA